MAENLAEAIAERYAADNPPPPPFAVDPDLEDAATQLEELRRTDPGLANAPGMAPARQAVSRYQLDKARALQARFTR